MSFDPTQLMVSTAIGLAIGGATFFVRATSDSKVSAAMLTMTGKVEALGASVMEKMDGLREALHGVAIANSSTAERHASLSAAHEKLDIRMTAEHAKLDSRMTAENEKIDVRVSRIERDLYTTAHTRAANGAAE